MPRTTGSTSDGILAATPSLSPAPPDPEEQRRPMSTLDEADPRLDRRIEDVVADDADLRPIAEALASRRDAILEAWLEAASAQPFHAEKPDAAVADHIPALLDAVVEVLRRSVRRDDVLAPMDDAAVSQAAADHARVRFEQGLGPVAVATEFRLLRHEISRALHQVVADEPAADVLAGQAVIDDALDGAAAVGLASLSQRIETLREDFLATTLHDVRQPITLVTGSLDLAARWLAEPDPDPRRVADVIEGAVVAVGEINAMLDTLGDASRIAMGALDPDLEPASLETIASDSIALVDRDARNRVTLSAPPGRRLIGLWDPSLLRRVVLNLLGNALKYSPLDARVDVVLQREDAVTARMEVHDRGMGMSAQELEALFQRFGRAERARAEGIPGLGLGLYACHGIVAAHGGTIAVHSDGPGTGTTVVVLLPLLADDDPAV
jgi:signal transduction histidine kinase